MDRNLKKALKKSFTPPPARHREDFIDCIQYPKATFREVVISQFTFIRKGTWVLFMLSVCLAFFYTQFEKVPESIVSGISAILPFFSLCMVTEIHKSTACNMEEMELACKYNLPKVTLMRIGLLGTVSFMMLALLVMIAGKSDFGALRNTMYICVPYLMTSYISLMVISKFRSRETVYICAGISGAVSIFMMIAGSEYQRIYNADYTSVWMTISAMLVGLLFYSVVQYIKSQEELQWNLL